MPGVARMARELSKLSRESVHEAVDKHVDIGGNPCSVWLGGRCLFNRQMASEHFGAVFGAEFLDAIIQGCNYFVQTLPPLFGDTHACLLAV